jgi:hypothetical protein
MFESSIKIAEENLLKNENEKNKYNEDQLHIIHWDRRLEESKWLFKRNEEDKNNDDNIIKEIIQNKKNNINSEFGTSMKRDIENMFKSVKTVTTFFNSNNSKKEISSNDTNNTFSKSSRIRDENLIKKEKIVKKMIEDEQEKKINNFFMNVTSKLKILENVANLLKFPKMPPHHQPAKVLFSL